VAAPNLHGTALVIGDCGLLILGPSGSGKSTLALALLSRFGGAGRLVRLVADDQVLVSVRNGRLLCRAPATISGLAEVHGVGPSKLAFEPAAVIDLAVRCLPKHQVERLPDEAFETIAGCSLPLLAVREREVEPALAAIAARLSLPPFGRGG
jgi:serine kinase of HPr protein (carbohydrate metabolism regulator)